MDHGIGTGGAAGDYLQRAADGILHPAGDGQQHLHLLRRGPHGAVAAEVHAYAGQVDMGQPALHIQAGLHHFLVVPVALPQVAQIRHDDDGVGLILSGTLLLQQVQSLALALQRHFTQPYQLRQLRGAGDADQQIGAGDARLAAALHLLQTTGSQLRDAAFPEAAGHLRQAIDALDDAADLDSAGGAAGDSLPGVAAEGRVTQYQSGVLTVHFHSSSHLRPKAVRLTGIVYHIRRQNATLILCKL